jgi:hypothetical protein
MIAPGLIAGDCRLLAQQVASVAPNADAGADADQVQLHRSDEGAGEMKRPYAFRRHAGFLSHRPGRSGALTKARCVGLIGPWWLAWMRLDLRGPA